VVAAAVRAIVEAQKALRHDVQLAAEVGRKLFPREQADLIVDVVERDLPYYDATIAEVAVVGLNRFTRRAGLLKGHLAYENVVATRFSCLWNG
jgi:hypothetical protein